MNKKYFLSLILYFSILSVAVSQASTTMILEGFSPDPIYIQEVSSSQNILTGTLLIKRTNTSKDEDFVVDLRPVSTARQSWEYNYTEGYQSIDQANIYTSSQNMNQTTRIAKTWGIEQNTTASNFWTGTLLAGESQKQITYYLKFQDYNTPPPPQGTYQLDLEFRLWNWQYNGIQSPPASLVPYIRPITLTAVMGPYVFVYFADVNSIPIGSIALDETSEKTIDLKVLTKANMPYDVTVTSINGGTLNLNTGTTIEKISYNLWVVDMINPINFTETPVKTVLVNQPTMTFSTPPAEHDARIQVLFDSNANYTAGRYSDILRLEIKAH